MMWPISATLLGLMQYTSGHGLPIQGIIFTWACFALSRFMLCYVNSYWIYNIVTASAIYLTIHFDKDMITYAMPLLGSQLWMIIFLLVGKFDYKGVYKEIQDEVRCSEWENQDIKLLF